MPIVALNRNSQTYYIFIYLSLENICKTRLFRQMSFFSLFAFSFFSRLYWSKHQPNDGAGGQIMSEHRMTKSNSIEWFPIYGIDFLCLQSLFLPFFVKLFVFPLCFETRYILFSLRRHPIEFWFNLLKLANRSEI